MSLTRSPDFPTEAAQLVDAMNRLADGHDPIDVLNAACQLIAIGVIYLAKDEQLALDEAIAYVRDELCDRVIVDSIRNNWDGPQRPPDAIPVGRQ